ncbi:MupG family TIM beta-alpha barrel fold protein [Planococcus sp. N028]|uniref:MupG family TIM beta-alpha barrel fold protein n=1 Tax=Planococcus shixiaomingii TaxID=3058393 RepID=A0ABT8N4Z2_9BACL|nr:MupG family TIM beta-alpha barrel fold protein [Planococcus sp. N028]MDN7242957.1 MupG family TIM beta-alpha barrel fold protein [Planococcus sp. N028]
MRGISVYLGEGPVINLKPYIQQLRKIGFSSIFTSLHIPEDNPSVYKERLQELGAVASELDMELMADISPKSLAHLGFDWGNAEGLLDWGVAGLRIDYGIEEKIIVDLSKKMKIALNASTLTVESLERLKIMGLQSESVEAWHNFYPRPETGLDSQEFARVNQWLKQEGLTVMAFVPGDGKRRGPLFQGLPTLEDHRNSSPFAAYLDLLNLYSVDKILVGDPAISQESMDQFELFDQGVIQLRAEAFAVDSLLLERLAAVQTNRWDAARDCVRSMESREYGLIGTQPVTSQNTIERKCGSITVDNEKYGRYQGEIQLAKRDLPADEKVNVIGRIIEEDQPLLLNISGGSKFQLKWV